MNIKYVVVYFYDLYTADYTEIAHFDNVEDAIRCVKYLAAKNTDNKTSYEIIVDFD